MGRDLYNRAPEALNVKEESVGALQSRFINRVFGWMSAGLALTGLISYYVAANYAEYIATHQGVMMLLIVAELLVVFGLTFAINKISSAAAIGGFLFYAALNGVTLSVIFLIYTTSSIAQVFFITCGMFAGMGIYGYVTKRDLTSIGSLCGMALWGLILGLVINLFLRSGTFDLILSWLGVLLFVGLTAYDTQKIKQMAIGYGNGAIEEESSRKMAVLGALALYLDFINIFLYLLRLFGNRR